MRPRLGPAPAGFTLIEVMIAMVIGLAVLAAATALALSTWRSLAGTGLRDDLDRNARLIGLALQRDLQEAGVGLTSTPTFGSLAAWRDTLAILRVPFEPAEAPVHPLVPPPGTDNPLAPGGTCGPTCIEVTRDPATFQLAPGDLVRLQVAATRRVILLTDVSATATAARLQFTGHDVLLRHPAGFAGGLRLDRFGTAVQELAMTAYWLEGGQLMRAQRLNPDGTPRGEVLATGVQSFVVTLVFRNGPEAPIADGTDADPANDYDDITGVRVRAVLQAANADPRVNQGNLITRRYEWFIAPRNLMYERNRL